MPFEGDGERQSRILQVKNFRKPLEGPGFAPQISKNFAGKSRGLELCQGGPSREQLSLHRDVQEKEQAASRQGASSSGAPSWPETESLVWAAYWAQALPVPLQPETPDQH